MMQCCSFLPLLSVITDARHPGVKSATCSRGDSGGDEDKASELGGNLTGSGAGQELKGVPAYWEEVTHEIKSL